MTNHHATDQSGFTLLEMLVALAILSIAALALVRLDAFTVRSTTDLDTRLIARIVAANAAADALTDPAPPTIGQSRSSITNGGIVWTINQQVTATADPSVLRIEIRVTAPDGTPARLTTVRVTG
ncbi:type II secretion system minor pseudopilin GspI [Sphingomonas lacunae]|uniref:Type II secretion system protein I n=1 Tax=Sphingomonas lacunae TaxID=2698828 RepID=A0A6M4AT44_9SPHN|nr:type II secretion system minor pseudopilin GspI [Sphingomonas lacunae]QJQ32244.1 type II secretion system minor pseudopilin GspI [Sphingomonas lacunae]